MDLPAPNPDTDRMEVFADLSLGREGTMDADIRIVFRGVNGDMLRTAILSAREAERKLILQEVANTYLPGASEISGDFVNLDDSSLPFGLNVRCRLVRA